MADGETNLGDLKVAVEDADKALATALGEGTTFQKLDVSGSGSHGYQLLPKPLLLSGSDRFDLGGTSLVIGAGASLQLLVSAFNTPDDVDADGIVKPAAGDAWLKNEIAAAVRGQGGGKVGVVGRVRYGLDMAADTTARLLDYRHHGEADPVAAAVLASLAKPRFAVDVTGAGLRALVQGDAGDALAYVVRGSLAFTVRLPYSDVLGGSLAALDSLLGVTGAAAFTADLSGVVEMSVGATDDFRLVFRRGERQPLAVDLQKSLGSRTGVAGSLGVEAAFLHPEQLSPLVSTYLLGRLGVALPELQTLLAQLAAATAPSQLDPSARTPAEQVAARLGLGDLASRFGDLKARLDGLPAKLAAKLQQVLAEKVKLTFTASYTRVETGEALLRFEATPGALAPFHRQLLLGDTTGVSAQLAAGAPGFTLVEFLSVRQVEETLSFGVQLAVGSWTAAGTATVDTLLREQKNVAGEVRVSFDGRQSYQGNWNRDHERYGLELGAAMEHFSSDPQGRDFTFTLGLGWSWEEDLSPGLLHTLLDVANVWRVTDPRDNAGLRASLAPLAGKRVRAALDLRAGDDGVRRLLKVPAALLERAWVQAMAEALPSLEVGEVFLRPDLLERRQIYTGVAQWAFDQHDTADFLPTPSYSAVHPSLPAGDLHQLQTIDLERALGQPGQPGGGSFEVYSLYKLWQPRVRAVNSWSRYSQVAGALARWQEVVAGERRYPEIERAFRDLQSVVAEGYQARLLGSLFGQLLAGPAGFLTGSLTVTPEKGGQAVVIGGAARG